MIERKLYACAAAALCFLISAGGALAQEAAPAQQQPPSLGTVLWNFLPMFAVVYLIFHFLVFRPQAARERAQRDLLQSLKRGEQVVTSSGIVGRVASVEGDYVLIEVSNNVRVKFETAHVTKRLTPRSEQKAAEKHEKKHDEKVAEEKKAARGA